MSIIESFRIAIRGLLANRLRSGLTMLGLVIGIGSVISLVSFGNGFQSYVNQTFSSIGSNLLFIVAIPTTGPDAKSLKSKPLTMDDAVAIANPQNVAGIAAVAPQYTLIGKMVENGYDFTGQVLGVTPPWQNIRNWPLTEGRFIEDTDVSQQTRVAVLGSAAVSKLFDGGTDPVGQDIRINNVPFRIVGTLQEKGGIGNPDLSVLIPISTAQARMADSTVRTANGQYKVSMIFAQSAGDGSTNGVKSQIEQLLAARHEIPYTGDEDFVVITQDQILGVLGSVTGVLTVFLSLIAGISLLVGGIGVMNIMLVSVTERTREIGLRKAVGARYSDLIMQFLIESIVLCLIGGAGGIAIGSIVAFIAGKAIPSLSLSVTPSAVLLATGVSTVIGVFFGLYPASRAASQDPIEALRYE
ncbi:MAG TPA: ABC transporter permease [Aggregatilineales bacterium]|nr:ABC transporter permease [Aggregatilineales bacterium]